MSPRMVPPFFQWTIRTSQCARRWTPPLTLRPNSGRQGPAPRADDDQVGVALLGHAQDLVRRIAQTGPELARHALLGEESGGVA